MKIAKVTGMAIVSLLLITSIAFAGGRGDQENANAINWIHSGAGNEPHSWEQRSIPMLEQFHRETGIKVNTEWYAHGDFFQVIEVRIASGRARDIDVLGIDVPMVASYAVREIIAPMDRFFTSEEKRAFVPSAVEAGSWQGIFYAPPIQSSSQLLWYNMTLLNQAGINVRDSNVNNRLTYEEITEMTRQALDRLDPNRTQGIGGFMFEQVSRVYQMNALPNSMGEASIGIDGFTVDGVINTAGWIRALTWYQSLFNDGLALRGFTPDEVSNIFRSGRLIFLIGGTWNLEGNTHAGIDFGYAPVPAFRGFENRVATPTGSWHLGINRYSQKQDNAAVFVKWKTMGEGNRIWIETTNNTPSTQYSVNRMQNDPDVHPVFRIAAWEAANTAFPRPVTPGFPEYTTILDAAWEDVRNGSDVRTALNNAARDITSAFRRFR